MHEIDLLAIISDNSGEYINGEELDNSFPIMYLKRYDSAESVSEN